MDFITENNRIYSVDANGKVISEITFPEVENGVVDINRTFVDSSLRGQGVAGKLMELAFNKIDQLNKKTVLSCPYAEKWVAQNEQYQKYLK